MTRIPAHTLDDAPEGSRHALEAVAQRYGTTPNIYAQVAHAPAVINGPLAAPAARYCDVRRLTEVLAEPLCAEDQTVQSIPPGSAPRRDAKPRKPSSRARPPPQEHIGPRSRIRKGGNPTQNSRRRLQARRKRQLLPARGRVLSRQALV